MKEPIYFGYTSAPIDYGRAVHMLPEPPSVHDATVFYEHGVKCLGYKVAADAERVRRELAGQGRTVSTVGKADSLGLFYFRIY